MGREQSRKTKNEQFPLANVTILGNTLQSQFAACIGGTGLSVLPCFIADPFPDLIRVLAPQEVFTKNIWLTMHHDIRNLSKTRAVDQCLQKILQHNNKHLLALNQ